MKNTIKKLGNDSLIKNSIYLMMTNVLNAIIGFLFWVLASKYYTPSDIGIISSVLSSSTLISMIGTLGLPTALMYYLPRDSRNANKIISSSLLLSIATPVIFSLIFILGIETWLPELKILYNLEFLIIFMIITTMGTMSSIMSGAFVAGKRSSYTMVKDTIFCSAKMILLTIFAGFGIIGIFISWGLGLSIAIIIGFTLLYKTWKYVPTLKFDPIIMDMTKFSLESYIAEILNMLPKMILPMVIINVISAESTGYFYVAITAAGLLYGISQSISTSLLAESSNKEKFDNSINKAIGLNILVLIPGVLFFIMFGKFVLNIFNPIYAQNATDTLIILSIASIPLSLISIFNGVRKSRNRVLSTVRMNLIVAITTIISTVSLMKTHGIEGVAISFLIANTVGALIVIGNTKNPKEFVLRFLNNVRNNVTY